MDEKIKEVSDMSWNGDFDCSKHVDHNIIEMVSLCEFTGSNADLDKNIIDELSIYSCYRIEVERSHKYVDVQKAVYVPKLEHELYMSWKNEIEKELNSSFGCDVLIRRIARKHGFRLGPKP